MLIIGCDYHPGFQQIAFVDSESGELGERRLVHAEEAERFYGGPKQRNVAVRVGNGFECNRDLVPTTSRSTAAFRLSASWNQRATTRILQFCDITDHLLLLQRQQEEGLARLF
jgi:hypothetical protein